MKLTSAGNLSVDVSHKKCRKCQSIGTLKWDEFANDAACSECCEWQGYKTYFSTGKVSFFISNKPDYFPEVDCPEYGILVEDSENLFFYDSFYNGNPSKIHSAVSKDEVFQCISDGDLTETLSESKIVKIGGG